MKHELSFAVPWRHRNAHALRCSLDAFERIEQRREMVRRCERGRRQHLLPGPVAVTTARLVALLLAPLLLAVALAWAVAYVEGRS